MKRGKMCRGWEGKPETEARLSLSAALRPDTMHFATQLLIHKLRDGVLMHSWREIRNWSPRDQM